MQYYTLLWDGWNEVLKLIQDRTPKNKKRRELRYRQTGRVNTY